MDLKVLLELGFFSDLDFHFAKTMHGIADESDDLVIFSCALLSKMLADGHVCVDITKLGGTGMKIAGDEEFTVRLPESEIWLEKLSHSALVSSTPQTPLVLDDSGRLHLAKYYDFQCRLVANIIKRASKPNTVHPSNPESGLEPDLFPEALRGVEEQKKAVMHAVENRFTIISGGPGTGKTFVSRAIKTVFGQVFFKCHNREPVILSLAPTGKAASKMDNGRTIHSVLKPYAHKPGFRFNRDNPLTADAVIIDEASMVDLLLLTRLLEAIPPEAHVILMGDRHQLASVQAGSVFSDICGSKAMIGHVHELTHNFRSGEKSGIHKLANAVRGNRFSEVKTILVQKDLPDVAFCPLQTGKELEDQLSSYITAGYSPIQNEPDPVKALSDIDRFRILCAHNSGEYGTLQINHICENILRSQGNSGIPKGLFKKVVMVNVNDYGKDLFNGDTGLVSAAGENHLFFLKPSSGRVRSMRYSQIPGHETAFAITVHKSQGSEFSQVLLLVPERLSPVLTRRLLYTGITRARDKLIIIGHMDMIEAAMNQDMERYSGIDRMLTAAVDRRLKTG